MASDTARMIVCLMAMSGFLQLTSAAVYEVGGSFGWDLPPNTTFYSEWASSINFFVGDRLVFRSNGNVSDNYAEPSSLSEYQNCTNPGFVVSLYRTVSVTTTLVESGTYYFISAADNHCESGQKFTINVSTQPGTTSLPPPSLAPSLSYSSGSALLVAAVAIVGLTL